MQNAAASWLMTSLNPDPFTVSLVQVATSLPLFLFALPAGALADIVDRRRLLIGVQVAVTALVAAFGVLVWVGRATPLFLLTFSFLAATAAALILPAWQSIVPQLVPREQLQPAVALNSVGLNVSRAVGPALAGIIIAAWGLAAPFWINAVTTLGVIAALTWWHPRDEGENFVISLPSNFTGRLPPACDTHAIIPICVPPSSALPDFLFLPAHIGRCCHSSPAIRSQGGLSFTAYSLALLASAQCALPLPSLGSSAVWALTELVAGGTIGTAVALVLFALAKEPAVALAASLIAGVSWIAILATINVSAQVALPSWVRGRGLSIFGTVMFGSLTLGSALWGKVATLTSLPVAHLIAAAGATLAVPLLWSQKLQTGADLDLAPSMHWPAPVLSPNIEPDRGPVLVTVEYLVRPQDRDEFLAAIAKLAGERRRDGAFDWGVYEDTAREGRFVETFKVDSWIEHMRQHERVTHADRELQESVNRFQISGAPTVTHLIAST